MTKRCQVRFRLPWIRLVASICLLVSPTLGYRHLQAQIPNGERVPHPCKPNELWEGVGHFQRVGGGHRDPFGQDFDDAGETWTEALCRKDSDGDGKTNGQELGDPNCMWRPGDLPKVTSGLSHPGVCEPLDSLTCQQHSFSVGLYRAQEEWMADACKRDEFVCGGLDDPDLKNVSIKFPKTPVPAKETTYMCVMFEFPETERDFHMIATTPILDNRQVMHHAVLFGCTEETNDVPVGTPYMCGMTPHQSCSTMLSIWTLGQSGECFHSSAGVRMGETGIKKMALQLHWNNPEQLDTYEDSSGMTLHYTPNLRPNDASIWMTGNEDFEIPPGQDRVTMESTCTSTCTQNLMTQPLYITAAWNHMHYLGVRQSIEHYRNGVSLGYITNDLTYSYDSPKTHEYVTPVEVLPGDELKTTCHYNSKTRNTTTAWGDSTQDEMCYGFLTYYPAHALTDMSCTTVRGSFAYCDPLTLKGCNATKFWLENKQFWATVNQNCNSGVCYAECKAFLQEGMKGDFCLTHTDFMAHFKKWSLHMDSLRSELLAKLSSCDREIYGEMASGVSALTSSLAPILLTVLLQ